MNTLAISWTIQFYFKGENNAVRNYNYNYDSLLLIKFARLFPCRCTENLYYSYNAIRICVARCSQIAPISVVPILCTSTNNRLFMNCPY